MRKKLLLILLSLILILLPSCNNVPDEPVDPTDRDQAQFIEDGSFSYPRIKPTDAEIEEIKAAIESNYKVPQEYKIQVGENCEIDIEDDISAVDKVYYSEWSFLNDISATRQKYDPTVAMFDEAVFSPNASGSCVYLLLSVKRCERNLIFSEITEATLSDGTLNFTISVTPNPYYDPQAETVDMELAYAKPILLKINKTSLSGKITDLHVEFNYIDPVEE